MFKTEPILQAIHRNFDNASTDGVRYGCDSFISHIKIDAQTNPYKLMLYGLNTGFGVHRLAISVQNEGGIFSQNQPERVELSHIGVQAAANIVRPPRIEQLFLPGDDNFYLFGELQQEVGQLRPQLVGALAAADIIMEPTSFLFEDLPRGNYFNDRTYDRTYMRSVKMKAASNGQDNGQDAVQLKFNANRVVSFEQAEAHADCTSDEVVLYRSGMVTLGKELPLDQKAVTMEGLLAFSGLHAAVAKLYRRSQN